MSREYTGPGYSSGDASCRPAHPSVINDRFSKFALTLLRRGIFDAGVRYLPATHDELLAFCCGAASRACGSWKSPLGQRGCVNWVA